MKTYNKLKNEIMCGLNKGYYVTVTFMSKTIPLQLIINKQAPLNYLLERIRFILLFYNNVLYENVGKITVNWDCRSLQTYIFVDVTNG